MAEKLKDLFNGARRIEWVIIIMLIMLVAMFLMDGEGAFQENTTLEGRLEHVLNAIDGVEDPRVMVSCREDGSTQGVVVVAGGVSQMRPRLKVQSAIQTLLNVEVSQIEIIDRK